MKLNISDIPIPTSMRKLPLDRRGYPIPAKIMRDAEGKAHFTVNDERIRQHQLRNDLCPVCNEPLLSMRWFVGGPMSFMLEEGRLIDIPMHKPCAVYALKVCPYLALPSYRGMLSEKVVERKKAELGTEMLVNPSMMTTRPDVFMLVGAPKTQKFTAPGQPNFIEFVKPAGPGKKQNTGAMASGCPTAKAALWPLPMFRERDR